MADTSLSIRCRATGRFGSGSLLAARGLTMGDYIILSRLADAPATSQLALARAVRHDKSRIIGLLDGLQHRGLIRRAPDPADRRSHPITITATGRRVQTGAQRSIRAMEEDLLQPLSAVERRSLLTALAKLDGGDGETGLSRGPPGRRSGPRRAGRAAPARRSDHPAASP